MNARHKALAFVAFLVLPAAARAEEPRQPPGLAPAVAKDLCNYLKDVEGRTAEACTPEGLIALQKQGAEAFKSRLALVRQRKIGVQAAYDFLKALPSDGAPSPQTGATAAESKSNPLHLSPPINERTFPVWIGTDATDLQAVYARWLKAKSAELKIEQLGADTDERRKEIAAALARNESRLARLDKIKDPSELNCYLGESCGVRGENPGPNVAAAGAGHAWTVDDFNRANAQTLAQTRAPGGKLDRGVPSLAASAAIDNSPLGPLTGAPSNNGSSPVRSAAELALVASGGLLLFGGLGGRQLEEKYPGIRRNMGIAALIGGSLATGGLVWDAHVARIAAAAAPLAINPVVKEESAETLSAMPEVQVAAEARIPQSIESRPDLIQEHRRLLARYGGDQFKELENGAIRYYGQLRGARTPGDMIGQRTVREWNPLTGVSRTWFETIDKSGVIRIIRPETGGPKIHYYFDQAGNYAGSR